MPVQVVSGNAITTSRIDDLMSDLLNGTFDATSFQDGQSIICSSPPTACAHGWRGDRDQNSGFESHCHVGRRKLRDKNAHKQMIFYCFSGVSVQREVAIDCL